MNPKVPFTLWVHHQWHLPCQRIQMASDEVSPTSEDPLPIDTALHWYISIRHKVMLGEATIQDVTHPTLSPKICTLASVHICRGPLQTNRKPGDTSNVQKYDRVAMLTKNYRRAKIPDKIRPGETSRQTIYHSGWEDKQVRMRGQMSRKNSSFLTNWKPSETRMQMTGRAIA